MDADTYVFAGGGTGGHLFPGLAVAAELLRIRPDARALFYTTDRPLDRELIAAAAERAGGAHLAAPRDERSAAHPGGPGGAIVQVEQGVRPLSSRPWEWPAFWRAWRASVNAARRAFESVPPRVVLGLGGYAAGPPVAAAQRLGIRTAILNPDAVPGRANRFLARRADLVIVQWEVTKGRFAPRAACEASGCPIRAEFLRAVREDGLRRFGLDPARPVLLVTGASQGAHSINRTMQRVWPIFSIERPEWQLLHLTGAADEAETRAAYAADEGRPPASSAPEHASTTAIVVPFTHEMAYAIAAADVVVSRAGASTLAELTALGKPSILLPYPYHRDRHQHANARVLVDAGAALLVEDNKDAERNREPLLAALRRLAEPAVRRRMSQAARRLARPDAARRVAEWMVGPVRVGVEPENLAR